MQLCLTQEQSSSEGRRQQSISSQQLDDLYKTQLTDAYIQKYSSEHSSQKLSPFFCLRPLKDFTLTNVRQQAKFHEVKKAIEKLKGFKIECQSLSLVDESELFSQQSPIR